MSLAPSTIVLAALTAIPFGLAIRDTVQGTYDVPALAKFAPAPALEDDRDVARRAAEVDREVRELQEREEREQREQRAKQLATLYGAEVATLGSAFADVTLGAAPKERLEDEQVDDGGYRVDIHQMDGVQHAVLVHVGGHDTHCRVLESKLREVWGVGRRLGFREVWTHPHLRQHAVLTSGEDCTLMFERFVTVDVWLDTTTKSIVPLWAIGQPAARLVGALGDKATQVPEMIHWTTLGLGGGHDRTELEAHLVNGRVVTIVARAFGDDTLKDAIATRVDRVTRRTSTPDSDLDLRVWSSAPRIELRGGEPIELVIGKPRPKE